MKYFIIYHFGGFYLDLDISCRRSLQPLQQFPAWLPRASPQGLNNDAMAARARHPAWKTMIDMLKPRNKSLVFPYLTVFWSTGPQFATDMVKQYLDENPRHKEYVPGASKANADPDDIFILPQEFYSEQYTFFGHSPGGTWHEGDVGVFVWLIDRPWVGIVVISLLLAIVFLAYPALRPGRDLLRTRWGQYKQVQQDEELADFSASDSER
jgi:mannosyltransferase OCH1-like enzyme